MIVELGHFALILALLVALLQAVVPMVGAARGWADWMRVAAADAWRCGTIASTWGAART